MALSFFISGVRIALRARYPLISLVAIVFFLGAAFLSSFFSGRQPATVALDVGLSVLRLLLPIVLVMVTQELLSKEFELRYFLSSLAYPSARYKILLGRFFAVVGLTLGLLLVMSLLLVFLVELVGKVYAQATPVALGWNYSMTIGFIGVDLVLLSALACLLAVVASTPSFVLIGTLGFMLVARSFAAVVELLSRDASVVGYVESYRTGAGILGYLLPNLGALDIRAVALYGNMDFLPADWPWLLLSSFVYTVGLLAFAIWALQRKRFV